MMKRKFRTGKVITGFEGVDIHSDLYYATRVYSTLLLGMSSRLFQKFEKKDWFIAYTAVVFLF